MLLRHNRTQDWAGEEWTGEERTRTEYPAHAPDTVLDAVQTLATALLVQWRWIAATTVAALAGALLFVALSDPLYHSNAQILIDPRGKQILHNEVVPTGLGQSAAGADTLLVDSQVEIILSDTVLKAVVASENLANDREFARIRGGGLGGLIAGIARVGEPGMARPRPRAETPEEAALETLRRRLGVRRVGNTYIVDISVLSEYPEKAARLANAVAAAYLNEERDATRASTRAATAMLTSRLDELRRQVNEAEGRVEEYRETHGLIGTQDLLVSEQQLRDLNDRLTTARTRTSETRVKYETLQGVAETGVSGAESLSEAITSRTVAGLRVAYGEIVRQAESASANLGPGHPRVRTLEAERRGLARTIDEELARLAANAKQEYDVALSHEQSLSERLEGLKDLAGQSNRALVELRELQREAEAARAVYEAFLVRTKQTSEQEDVFGSNARILTEASASSRHAYPPVRLVGAAALLMGLMLGCMLAWIRYFVATRRQSRAAPRYNYDNLYRAY